MMDGVKSAERSAGSARRLRLPQIRPRFAGWSLARRFLIVYIVLLAIATVAMGLWIGQQVEDGIVNRTAAVTSLYIESFVGPHVQSLATQPALSGTDATALHDLLAGTELGQNIVSFKIWSRDGVILYSPTAELMGEKYPIDGDLARSLDGEITADISNLSAEENDFERQHWSRLLQMYVPVRQNGSGQILAVAEFYQTPDALDAEVATARFRSWAIVLLAALASFVLVAFIVKRASDTIARQQGRLRNQVTELSGLLGEVADLHSRLKQAAGQTVEITTQERRRISADLHDGPAQAMALALLQLESVQTADGPDGRPDARIDAAYGAMNDALGELRQIAAGLRLPDLAPLPTDEVIRRAIDDHRRRSGIDVASEIGELPTEAPLAVKIALFRGLQEALSNATRHGGGIGVEVRAWLARDVVHLEIRDRGPGFDPERATREGALGLAGMKERAALLGGALHLVSRHGEGAIVRLSLPLHEDYPVAEATNAQAFAPSLDRSTS